MGNGRYSCQSYLVLVLQALADRKERYLGTYFRCNRRPERVYLVVCEGLPRLGHLKLCTTQPLGPCLAVSQEATSLESGTNLEKGTGVIVLTRYAGISEEFFTRAADFVPER